MADPIPLPPSTDPQAPVAPEQQPVQYSNYEAEQAQTKAETEEKGKLSWSNLPTRLLGAGSGVDQMGQLWGIHPIRAMQGGNLTDLFTPIDDNYEPPKSSDPRFEGLSEGQKYQILSNVRGDTDLNMRIAHAHDENDRAQLLAASSLGVKLTSALGAESIPYLPLMLIPGLNAEAAGTRMAAIGKGFFSANAFKNVVEGTVMASALSQYDPNDEGSLGLAKGAMNMWLMGGAMHGVLSQFGKFPGRIKPPETNSVGEPVEFEWDANQLNNLQTTNARGQKLLPGKPTIHQGWEPAGLIGFEGYHAEYSASDLGKLTPEAQWAAHWQAMDRAREEAGLHPTHATAPGQEPPTLSEIPTVEGKPPSDRVADRREYGEDLGEIPTLHAANPPRSGQTVEGERVKNKVGRMNPPNGPEYNFTYEGGDLAEPPTIHPPGRSREGQTFEGELVSNSVVPHDRTAADDAAHDIVMTQRHLDIDHMLDAQDAGKLDRKMLTDQTNAVLDAQRDIQESHAAVEQAQESAADMRRKIVDKAAEATREHMEQAGEIPVRKDVTHQLRAAWRDLAERRGDKVPLEELFHHLPEGTDEASALSSLKSLWDSGEAEMHAPEQPAEGSEATSEKGPKTYPMGDDVASHVSFDLPSRAEVKENLRKMREGSAKAKDHAELAKTLPEAADRRMSAQMRALEKRAKELQDKLQAEKDFFSGKTDTPPKDATERDIIEADEALKAKDIAEGNLPTAEAGDNVAPENALEDLGEDPVLPLDMAQKTVSDIQAKIAKQEGEKPSAVKQRKLQRLRDELEEAKDELKRSQKAAAKSGPQARPATLSAADKAEGKTLVTVDAKAFDSAWKDNRVEAGGAGGITEDNGTSRYERAKSQYAAGSTTEAPSVTVGKDGRVTFTDGRHRFAAMRDAGDGKIQVAMDSASKRAAKKAGLLGDQPKPMLDIPENYSDEYKKELLVASGRVRSEITNKPGQYTAHDVLRSIRGALGLGGDTHLFDLVDKLLARIGDIKVIVHNQKDFKITTLRGPQDAGGAYFPAGNFIELGRGADVHVVLHELVHAATTRFINQFPDHPATKQLEALLEHVKQHLQPGDEFYGLSDIHEFLAEAMTRPKFQKFLDSIDYSPKNKTVWAKLIDTVGNMIDTVSAHLGFRDPWDSRSSALAHAMAAFDYISQKNEPLSKTQRPKLTLKGQAMELGHAALPTDSTTYDQGNARERKFWWQKGGRYNPFWTRIDSATDQHLGTLSSQYGAEWFEPIVGDKTATDNRSTVFGMKKSMQDGGFQQIKRINDNYWRQWLAEDPNRGKRWQQNPFNHQAREEWEEAVHDAAEGNTSSPAATAAWKDMQKSFFDPYANRAKETGAQWAGGIEAGQGYHPRVHNANVQWDAHAAFGGGQAGSDAMADIWERAFTPRGQAMGLTPAEIRLIAEGYQKRLEAVNGGWDQYTGHGVNVGDTAFMRQMLVNAGHNPRQIDALISRLEDMRSEKTGGPVRPTQHRLTLDMSTPIQVPGMDTLHTVADLMDKRFFKNAERYNNTMSGAVAMALKGIPDRAAHEARMEANLKDMREQQPPVEQWRKDRYVDTMEAAYNNAIGAPNDDKQFKAWAQLLSMVRTLATTPRMGVSGIPIWLTNGIRNLGYGNFFNTMQRLGELRSLLGKNPDGTSQHAALNSLSQVLNIGIDHFGSKVFDHIADGPRTAGQRVIDMAQTVVNRTAQMVYNNPLGMTTAIRLTKGISAINILQRLAENLEGHSNSISDDFYKWLGPNADMGVRIRNVLREMTGGTRLASGDVSGGASRQNRAPWASININWGAATDYEARGRLISALQAYTNRQIHDEDYGASSDWMDSEIGKTMMQLRVFSYEAMKKQLGAGLNIGGAEGMGDMLVMSVGGALEYAARTWMNASQMTDDAKRQKYLEENWKFSRMAAASIARNPAGAMPASVVDSLLGFTGHSAFEGLRSTGLATGAFSMDSTPVGSFLQNTSKVLTDGLSGTPTQRTWNNLKAISPGANIFPLSGLWNVMGDALNLPARPPRAPRGAKVRGKPTLLDEATGEEE